MYIHPMYSRITDLPGKRGRADTHNYIAGVEGVKAVLHGTREQDGTRIGTPYTDISVMETTMIDYTL